MGRAGLPRGVPRPNHLASVVSVVSTLVSINFGLGYH
jgi:hypothetical protein